MLMGSCPTPTLNRAAKTAANKTEVQAVVFIFYLDVVALKWMLRNRCA